MIYLDNNATTPVIKEVMDVIMNSMIYDYANPASLSHLEGLKSSIRLKEYRDSICNDLGAETDSIYFNSGASESNNTILKSLAEIFSAEKIHIITSEIEHKCILNTCGYLERKGVEITYLPVNKRGAVNLDVLKKSINKYTRIISIMGANNETGVLQPIKEIGNIAKEKNIFFHTDLAQVIGKIPFSFRDYNIDFASFSAHKFYGPKGVGAIYCKHSNLLNCYPLIHGGDQEKGFRSGTINLAGIAGMAKAVSLIKVLCSEDKMKEMFELKLLLIKKLSDAIPDILINGDIYNSLPNTVNFSLNNLKSSTFLKKIKSKISLSSGSACMSTEQKGSHVLSAMNLSDDRIQSSIRLSFNHFTTEEDLINSVSIISETVNRFKKSS